MPVKAKKPTRDIPLRDPAKPDALQALDQRLIEFFNGDTAPVRYKHGRNWRGRKGRRKPDKPAA